MQIRDTLVLLAVSLVVLMINADLTVVNLAFVPISHSLQSNIMATQWILSAYMLSWAICLIPAGWASDKLGCKSVFLTGIAIFFISSLFAGLAHSIDQIIISRVLQGIGAALFVPTGYTITANTFSGKKLNYAFGVIGFYVGLGLIIGPTLGGAVIKFSSWRWIFWINIPVSLLIFLLIANLVKKPQILNEEFNRQNDNSIRWGVALLALAGLFRNKSFSSVVLLNMLSEFCYAAIMFLMAIYLEDIKALPALSSGIVLLALTAAFAIMSLLGGRLADLMSPKQIIFSSFVLLMIAVFCFIIVLAYAKIFWLIVTLVIAGCAFGVFFPISNTIMMQSVSENQVGIAASTFTTTGLIANAFSVFLTSFILEIVSKEKIFYLFSKANIILNEYHKTSVIMQLEHMLPLASQFSTYYRESLLFGVQTALFLCAVVAVLGVKFSYGKLKN